MASRGGATPATATRSSPELGAFPTTAPAQVFLHPGVGRAITETFVFTRCQKNLRKGQFCCWVMRQTQQHRQRGSLGAWVCHEENELIDSSNLVSFHPSFSIMQTRISCNSMTLYQSQPSYDSSRALVDSPDDLFPFRSQRSL